MSKLTQEPDQILYMGRWLPRKGFRTFVYGKDGQKLANSYVEYESLIMSGLYFVTKQEAENAFKEVEKPEEVIKSENNIQENDQESEKVMPINTKKRKVNNE